MTESVASSPLSSPLSLAAAHALREALGHLDRKRDRYLELFASGLITAPEELARHLARVAQERHALEAPRTPERAVSAGATRPASAEEVAQLEAEFLRVWPEDWARLLDAGKQALLERLRASVSVRILPHPTKVPGKTDRPRHNGGRLTLTLELPALGFAGMRALQVAETDEDLEDYWQWRGSFVGDGKAGLDTGKAGEGAAAEEDGHSPEYGDSPPPLRCRHCQSRRVIKGGYDQRGIQRFLCRDCKRSFHKAEDDRSCSHTAAFRAEVLAAYRDRASMRVVCHTFHISHRTLLGGASAPLPLDALTPACLDRALGLLKSSHRYLVLDVPPILHATTLHALTHADVVLLVANLFDLTTLADTRLWLEAVAGRHVAPEVVQVVLNRALPRNRLQTSDIERTLGRPAACLIPNDGKVVPHSVNAGEPFVLSHPTSRVARSVYALAQRLMAETPAVPDAPERSSR